MPDPAEIRIDPITKERVLFAPERMKRPRDAEVLAVQPKGLPKKICPFCPGNEDMTPTSKQEHNPHKSILYYRDGNDSWTTRVFPNKYPMFNLEESLDRRVNELYEHMGAFGAHEVIVESPSHDAEIHSMPREWVLRMLLAYRERALDLRGDKNLRYVSIFKNSGEEAGASLEHPHSQLIAEPTIPVHHQNMFPTLREHYELRQSCMFCDLVKHELKDGRRVIEKNKDFLAFTPYASKYPYTVNIIPLTHQTWFEDSSLQNLESLTDILRDVMGAIHRGLNNPPYNWYLRNAPVNTDANDLLRTCFDFKLTIIPIIPIMSKEAGYEKNTHNAVNVVYPEKAAEDLREMISVMQEERKEEALISMQK